MVIVTGGASGIGGAISTVIVARGAKVVAVDVNGDAAESLQQDLGATIRFVLGDVSDKAVAATAVELAGTTFGGFDGLVNNAHASRQAIFNDLTDSPSGTCPSTRVSAPPASSWRLPTRCWPSRAAPW